MSLNAPVRRGASRKATERKRATLWLLTWKKGRKEERKSNHGRIETGCIRNYEGVMCRVYLKLNNKRDEGRSITDCNLNLEF